MQYTVNNLRLTLTDGERSKTLKSSAQHPLCFTSPECRVVFMEAEDHFNGKVGSRHIKKSTHWVGAEVRRELGPIKDKANYWVVKLFGAPFSEDGEVFGCGHLEKPNDPVFNRLEGSLKVQPWKYPPVEEAFAGYEGNIGPLRFEIANILGVDFVVGRLASQSMFAVELWRVLAKPKPRIQFKKIQYDLNFREKTIHASRVTQWYINAYKSWAIPVTLINDRGFRELNGLPKARSRKPWMIDLKKYFGGKNVNFRED